LTTEWHTNGQVKGKGKAINGKFHGTWLSWNENGQLIGEQIFSYGDYIDGISEKHWNDNGTKHYYVEHKNGKRDGKYQMWHDNGQLFVDSFYKNGKEVGVTTYWHDNGVKS